MDKARMPKKGNSNVFGKADDTDRIKKYCHAD